MAWDTFVRIVDAINGQDVSVSLQGEGEPSLHPRFEDMAAYVSRKGHRPYTIINGSRVEPSSLESLFPTLGISIDTLDVAKAEQIGRHNLLKVLRHVDELIQVMNPERITIMTVDMGQPLDGLKTWVKDKGFGQHIIQPLSPKSDYASRYTVNSAAIMKQGPSICKYLQRRLTRFFTWDGQELPCCFMKDFSDFTTVPKLRTKLLMGESTKCCSGCPQLKGVNLPVISVHGQ